MLELNIDVKKNICNISQPTLTSGCVNAVACLFSFDDNWNGYELVASFESAYGTYHCLIENGKCNMPNAIVAHASSVKIGVIGKKGNITITTNTDTFFIDEGANKDGIKDPDYQPTLLEQILSITEKCKRIAESVRSDADAGKFNGADGKDYVLTDADKEVIADDAAESVVNACAIRETVYIGLDGYCYSADSIAYPISNLNITDSQDFKKYNFVLLNEDEWGEICEVIPLRCEHISTGEMLFSSANAGEYTYIWFYGQYLGDDEAITFTTVRPIGDYLKSDYGVISVDKEALLGDVETALDEIIAIKNTLIGGEGV